MDIKLAYKIRFAFEVKSEKDDEPVIKTYIKKIIAKDIDAAIDWGKNYIPNTFDNLDFYMNYIGCTVLKKEKIYILN